MVLAACNVTRVGVGLVVAGIIIVVVEIFHQENFHHTYNNNNVGKFVQR